MLRELNPSEIEEVLINNAICRIGCLDGGMMYIVPVYYRYEKGTAMCFSLEGLKIDMMRRNPDVCFEVEEIGDFSHWKSVIALLRPQYVEYMLRKRASLSALPPDERADGEHHQAKSADPVFYRIRFTKLTGRLEAGI